MQESKKENKFPEEGELLMGVVTKVFPYGVFVKLNDYPGVEGMIHISEISAKWVKNIRDHAKEGETLVVKVLRVDAGKGHVDLTLKSVKASQKKMIVEGHKQNQKAIKFVELAADKLKDKDSVQKVVETLEDKFESSHDAFQKAKREGVSIFKDIGLDEKWVKALTEIVNEHVTLPRVSIKAEMELHAKGPNGVDTIKTAISKAKEQCTGTELEAVFKYVGAPKYNVELTGLDYKTLEKCLDNITKVVTTELTKQGGTATVIKKK
ncbi:MAG: translation initiation factor IF-2 subunit alpha [archaeon]